MRAAVPEDIQAGLDAGEFRLCYQPQFDLCSNRLVAMEALVRWGHPHLGTLMPARFIAKAEADRSIHALDDWVLETACKQMARWAAQGLRLDHVAVNVSALQWERPNFVPYVESVLSRSGLAAERLMLELTESRVLPTDEPTLEALRRCRAGGIRLSLDDFGTGHANLLALHRLPVDQIKIDQGLFSQLPQDNKAAAIVGCALRLGHELGLCVVAEGVETQSQLDWLRQRPCRSYQGHLGAPALEADEFWKRYAPDREVSPEVCALP